MEKKDLAHQDMPPQSTVQPESIGEERQEYCPAPVGEGMPKDSTEPIKDYIRMIGIICVVYSCIIIVRQSR